MAIIPLRAEIDEAILDIIGNEFKFDHAKGIAEWLKNSVDAYNLENIRDDEQVIIIFLKLKNSKLIEEINVIDFVGMTIEKIEDAFKRWFDPNAAIKLKKDKIKKIKTLGGHGNGGKFYMRQMFERSYIITYRDGKLNKFGFENKQYGFDENFRNISIDFSQAIKIAELNNYKHLMEKIKSFARQKGNFTVVKGINPININKTAKVNDLIKKIVYHPQARRIIQRKKVYLTNNISDKIILLKTPEIPPNRNYEPKYEFVAPKEYSFENKKIILYKNKPVKLILYTSDFSLKTNKYRGLNSIDFIGEVGVIASYNIEEIGHFRSYAFSEFIYGECFAEEMEKEGYVKNDREKFTESDKTRALLDWVKACVAELCNTMESTEKKIKKRKNLKETSKYNDLLNKWKNKFLQKLLKERSLIDNNYSSNTQKGKDTASKKKNPKKGTSQNQSKKGNTQKAVFPKVLLSGFDKAPYLDNDEPFELDERHPPVYQGPEDYKYGIYWINTSKKIAEEIINKFGINSSIWRNYLFQRYVDIIVIETIYYYEISGGELSSDYIAQEIGRISSDIFDMAVNDLEEFLFSENFEI